MSEATKDAAPVAGSKLGDLLAAILPSEAAPIINVFENPFSMDNLFDAVEAGVRLGRKVQAYIVNGTPLFGMHETVAAKSVTNTELVAQFKAELAAAQPVQTGAAGDATGGGAVAINPALASLITTLVQRLAEMLFKKLSGG